MTDEEMAEKYCNEEVPFDTTESGEKLYTENDLKQAYLEGLKAGSQLDKVWHDYDAGEDCYEDNHEGKWVKREDNKPKWHKIASGDLPKDNRLVLIQMVNGNTTIGIYYVNIWREICNCRELTSVIAWCEIPKYTEE